MDNIKETNENLIVHYNQKDDKDLDRRQSLPKDTPLSNLIQQYELAEKHKRSLQIGIFSSFQEKCECCNRATPSTNYKVFDNTNPIDFYKFGIDLVHYHIFIDQYILLLAFFFVSYFIQFIFNVIINGGFDVSNSWKISYIEINYQEIMYKGGFFIDILFVFVRIVISLSVLFTLKNEIKKATIKYRKLIYDYHLDESSYAIFVKNIPYLTEMNCLIEYLNNTYKVNVLKGSFLEDYYEIEPLFKEYKLLKLRKDALEELSDPEREHEIKEISSTLELKQNAIVAEYNNLVLSKTAVIMFENIENKNVFFRKLRDNRRFDILICCCKEQNFRGNKLFFENINGIDSIIWGNISFSLEKAIKDSKLKTTILIVSLTSSSIIIFLINSLIFSSKSIFLFGINIYTIPLVKSIISIIFNETVGIILSTMVVSLRLSNEYLKEVFIRLIIIHKTFINSIVCYMLFYDDLVKSKKGAIEYSGFIQLIFLIAFKTVFFARFPMNIENLLRNIKYFYYVKIKKPSKFAQIDLNYYSENSPVNILELFSNFRILIYCGLILVRLYPLFAVALFLFIYFTKYCFKYVIYNSSFKKLFYSGFFFKIFLKQEFSFLILFNIAITYLGSEYLKGYNNIGLLILSDLSQILQFYFSFNDFFTEKTYSEAQSNFKYTFEKDNLKAQIERELICKMSNIKEEMVRSI